jgi:hypothetical protein
MVFANNATIIVEYRFPRVNFLKQRKSKFQNATENNQFFLFI